MPKNKGGNRCRGKNENEPEIRELVFKDNGAVSPRDLNVGKWATGSNVF